MGPHNVEKTYLVKGHRASLFNDSGALQIGTSKLFHMSISNVILIGSCSLACRRCSKYIFIVDLTPCFYGLGKDNCKARRETFKFWDLMPLMMEIWRYCHITGTMQLICYNFPGPVSWNVVNERAILGYNMSKSMSIPTATPEEAQQVCLNTEGCLSISYRNRIFTLNNITRLEAASNWVHKNNGYSYDIYYATRGRFGVESLLGQLLQTDEKAKLALGVGHASIITSVAFTR